MTSKFWICSLTRPFGPSLPPLPFIFGKSGSDFASDMFSHNCISERAFAKVITFARFSSQWSKQFGIHSPTSALSSSPLPAQMFHKSIMRACYVDFCNAWAQLFDIFCRDIVLFACVRLIFGKFDVSEKIFSCKVWLQSSSYLNQSKNRFSSARILFAVTICNSNFSFLFLIHRW